MKLKPIRIITLICAALCCQSCAFAQKNTDVYSIIEQISANESRGVLYFDRTRNAENDTFLTLAPEKLGYLYTGRFEPPECLDRVSSYALRLSADLEGGEIHVIECIDRSDTAEITALMSLRIERFQSSEVLWIAPETHEKYFKSATTYVKGRYAFLLATADNSSVIRQIEKIL